MNPIAEQLNFKIGKDIFVGYSPEKRGSRKCRLFYRDYQKSCFRYNKDCLDICSSFYATFTPILIL